MNTSTNQNVEIDITRMLQAILRRIWAVVLAAVLGGTVAFCYAAFQITPTYVASTLLFVNNSSVSLGSTSVSISRTDIYASAELVNTYVVILKTRLTLESVIEEANLDLTYEQLNDMVSAEAVDETQIFRVTVTSTDPSQAELIANTITKVLPEKIEDVVDGSSMRVVDYAVRPTTKASPNITKIASIGILAGLVLSCGVIVILELLDDGIHDTDSLTEAFADVPLLAEIPDLSEDGSSGHGRGYGYGYGYGYRKYKHHYGYGYGYGYGNTKHSTAKTNQGGKTNG